MFVLGGARTRETIHLPGSFFTECNLGLFVFAGCSKIKLGQLRACPYNYCDKWLEDRLSDEGVFFAL